MPPGESVSATPERVRPRENPGRSAARPAAIGRARVAGPKTGAAPTPGDARCPQARIAGPRCGAAPLPRLARPCRSEPAPGAAAPAHGASRHPAAERRGEEPGATGPPPPRRAAAAPFPARARQRGMGRDRPAEQIRAAGASRYPLCVCMPGFFKGLSCRSKCRCCRSPPFDPHTRAATVRSAPPQERSEQIFVPRDTPMPRECHRNAPGHSRDGGASPPALAVRQVTAN